MTEMNATITPLQMNPYTSIYLSCRQQNNSHLILDIRLSTLSGLDKQDVASFPKRI